ncbi:hypothetical protein EYF80_041273 [Liparis tanakae]|uniref:Uncharacterized protein n=1 Tax=Liparis tanakae TaxID=230148 RepID=A0A4Z2G4S8_9TELE|nr:hypothetical protein EYF80_041273 [Liparis tanakae]
METQRGTHSSTELLHHKHRRALCIAAWRMGHMSDRRGSIRLASIRRVLAGGMKTHLRATAAGRLCQDMTGEDGTEGKRARGLTDWLTD